MIKILHLIATLEGGGAERQLSMLAAEQSGRGWCVHVGIRRGGSYEESLRASGTAIHRLGDQDRVTLGLLTRINFLIKIIKPDIIQTWLPQMDIVGGIASLWNSVPWIVSERSSELAYPWFSLRGWVRFCFVRNASAVVANSSGGVAYWRDKLNDDAVIFRVSNAVDVTAIRTAVPGRYSTSKDNSKKILCVGRYTPVKAFEIIVQAVRYVPDSHSIHVTIMGEGPLREELAASIKTYGLENRIALIPYQLDWWGLLKSASMLVSMSRYEGQPNVVLEAMAMGCPLIVSDISAHRELLNASSAIMVPQENSLALAEAIVSVLADPVSADQRSQHAMAIVDGLTIQTAADAYELIYKKVINGRKD